MATKTAPRKVEYPDQQVVLYTSQNDDPGPLTLTLAKDLIGWETEEDFTARKKADEPKSKKDFLYGENFILRDSDGRKVMLWNNKGNRELDVTWAKKIAQDILNGHWHFNFENIIVSIYAQVLSGQHRLVAFILACELWALERNAASGKWRDVWPEEPTLDVSIAFGAPDDPLTRRTIDNVKTRSLSDVIYTSEFLTSAFKGEFHNLSLGDRGECSRMVSRAIGVLWKRTDSKRTYGENTHSTTMAFLENHKSLGDALAFMWKKDEERTISDEETGVGVSSGMATALLYLMAGSATDINDYIQGDPPSEKAMNWDLWEKAEDFWESLSKKKADVYPAVDKAIKARIGDTNGTPISAQERLHIIAEAWKAFAKRGKVSLADVKLNDDDAYIEKDEVKYLKEIPSVGGIDSGEVLVTDTQGDGEDPAPEDLEAKKERLRAEREVIREKLLANRKKNGKGTKPTKPEPETEEEPEVDDDTEEETLEEEPVADDEDEVIQEEE